MDTVWCAEDEFTERFPRFAEVMAGVPDRRDCDTWPVPPDHLGRMAWLPVQEGRKGQTMVDLATSDGDRLVTLNPKLYTLVAAAESRFVIGEVWRDVRGASLRLTSLDPTRLEHLGYRPSRFARDLLRWVGFLLSPVMPVWTVKTRKVAIKYRGGDAVRFHVRARLGPGTHRASYPEEFLGFGEFLLDFPWCAEGANSLLILRPREETAEIVPQRWLKDERLDLEDMYPCRYARDPRTNRIFGDTPCLPGFVLDETGHELLACVVPSEPPT